MITFTSVIRKKIEIEIEIELRYADENLFSSKLPAKAQESYFNEIFLQF